MCNSNVLNTSILPEYFTTAVKVLKGFVQILIALVQSNGSNNFFFLVQSFTSKSIVITGIKTIISLTSTKCIVLYI